MKNSQTFLGITFPARGSFRLTVMFWPKKRFILIVSCLFTNKANCSLTSCQFHTSIACHTISFGYVIITHRDARPRVLALIEMCFAAVASFFLIVFEWAFLFSGVLYFYFFMNCTTSFFVQWRHKNCGTLAEKLLNKSRNVPINRRNGHLWLLWHDICIKT